MGDALIRLHDGKHLLEDALHRPELERETMDFSPDGKSIVIGDKDGFKIYDLDTEKMTFASPPLNPPTNPHESPWVSRVEFSNDGTFILAWRRGALTRWNVAARCPLPLFISKDNIKQYSFSRDYKQMLCWYENHDNGNTVDQGFAVMELDTNKLIWEWPREGRRSGYASLASDGRRVAISDPDTHAVYILDLNDLK